MELNESICTLELLLKLINQKMSEDKDVKSITKLESELEVVDKSIQKLLDLALVSNMDASNFGKRNDELVTQ